MTKEHTKKLVSFFIYLILFCLIIPILITTISFKRDSPSTCNINTVEIMEMSIDDGEWKSVALPKLFKKLTPGTKLSFKATIYPNMDDGVFISSNFAKANVYFDNKLVFVFGKDENYPSFMQTSGKEIHVIEAYGNGDPVELRIDYFSPNCARTLKIDSPMVGSAKEIILEKSIKHGASWMFSLTQILGGASLIFMSLFFIIIDRKGSLFTWLGLFAYFSGLWFFGSNGFSITVFPNSAWLYISSYIGFAFCMLPLIRFLIHAVNFENSVILNIMELGYGILVITTIILQIFKIVPLHNTWYIYRFLIPVSLLVISMVLIYERIKWKNKYAGRFIAPMIILYLSATGETINRLFFHERLPVTLLFQTGIFLFLLLTGINAGLAMKDSLDLKKREEELAHKQNMVDIMTEDQRERSLELADNETRLSRQRHDLRHHLSAIMELSKGNKEIQEYLSTLIEKIPSKKERYCQNDIVNAIVSHYANLCESNNIDFKAVLDVPVLNDVTLNSDFCVIFANLLENAYEACSRMNKDENKFISIKSTFHGKLLTVTMDNSFNGEVTQIGERFRSAKRNDYGIGLTSIKSIAQQYHGDAKFTHKNKIFYSSIYLSI